MKRLLYLLPLLALARPALAQHTELIGRAGGNLAWFGGHDAASTSFINYGTYRGTTGGYPNSPYGRRAGVGFGLGGRVLRVTRPGVLLAFDLGYDWQQARTSITSVSVTTTRAFRPLCRPSTRPMAAPTTARRISAVAWG